MGELLELADRYWQGTAADGHPWKVTGKYEEIADGLFFVHVFANVSVLRTDEGLVLIDTGAWLGRDRTFGLVRRIDPSRLHTAIYTHGHADHAFGLPPFLEEANTKGLPRPRIVGHENVSARFERYRKTHGYNATINARQFSTPASWPTEFDAPDTTYQHDLRLEVGGLALELHHARGETDDHTWVFLPQRRILFTGDQFIWVTPNAGNPQKVQRYAADWALSLREMARLAPEVLVPGHGLPIVGAERARKALTDTAEWLEHLERETVARMNAGLSLDAILEEVRPPAHLEGRPYLQAVYDEPDYVVRNVWRLYGGWYDGIPSHLKPAPEAELGAEVAALAGGIDALVARARALAQAGNLRLACHLADWAVFADPGSRAAHAARAEIYEARTAESRALMTRGIFGAAARESGDKAKGA
ncbi:MAG TPA: alkyl sulfatase dimerization domain-containing protein [Myxococcota bacterium]|nr:alkyl sulfatase dimerization domain-containing protein [Myxococcota bacterium]